MATAQVSPDLPRPSFAKVAAVVSKEPPSGPSTGNDQGANVKHQPGAAAPIVVSGASANVAFLRNASLSKPGGQGTAREGSAAAERVASSLNDLKLSSRVPNLVVDGTPTALERQRALINRESVSDESQKCDSSSELGTKPPSLDGKSITSGTTFALDEKESLRPDDSASVKAAAEDDDAFSIRGSFIAGSRMSSEVAARARGIQLGDIPERRLAQQTLGIPGHGVITPQSSASERPPAVNPTIPLSVEGSSDALNVIYRQAPDEKLLDALSSPRDRFFLLRLEKDVIDFVQDSKEPYMDLPPSNSFCGTPPPAVLPKKIMRRGQDSEGGPLSAGASKPTSESGSDNKDGKEKQPFAKEKLSREEREELYKLARERIFGSSEDSVQENEGENGMSRTSSVSATNKANVGKRGKAGKQRRDDSDSFDSRYQYTPYWGPSQQTWVTQPQGQFMPPAAHGQFNGQPVPAYPAPVPPVYTQQPAAYPGLSGMAPSPAYPAYGMPLGPPQPPPPQRYQPSGSPMMAYGSPVPPAAVPQGWQPGFSAPPSYPPRGPAPTASQAQAGGVPYAFGQLPANANPHDPKSQHPIPGSYNRNHAFNPKTQSFVPGGNVMHPVQPPQPPFTAPGSHHGSPQIGTPHLAYVAYQTGVPPSYGGGYGMARQGSNTSLPSYHGPPHIQHVPLMPSMPPPPQQIPQNPSTQIPGRPACPQGPNQIYSHLPTYGNPASLPQKPASGV
ncbi:SUZ domain-containing protein [Hirsutella rhossiliensis]|uniref:SUZ domain-containing protein n=1 Tax=Hirsutella rhossiliensis TaxID=111463 RepID=A0A9P8SIF7_9HYPO|nr:SUZ domain-containing protein [Hirsutella rhossiliensis]KAH0963841.1 SUZ domain-containing protein [Hirsutella rhossiliensis]